MTPKKQMSKPTKKRNRTMTIGKLVGFTAEIESCDRDDGDFCLVIRDKNNGRTCKILMCNWQTEVIMKALTKQITQEKERVRREQEWITYRVAQYRKMLEEA